MEVVTLSPPTVRDSSATATSIPLPEASIVPSILYPVGNPILNNIDTLVVNYITPWSAVQMTVSCGATVEDPDSFSFRADNLPQNGPYDLSPVQQSFSPSRYPIYCHITLEDATNSENIVDSGQFIMTSTSGSPSLYGQSTTAVLPTAASETGTATGTPKPVSNNNDNDSNDNSAQTGSSVSSASPNPTAEAASASSTSPSSSQSSSGLSSGAKAGIAFAIIIFFTLLGLSIFFLLRYRRKIRSIESQLQQTQAEAAAAAARHADEKAYLDSILTVAGKPDTSSGGRIVVADLGSRQSGDWRQFFASKANSAKQAISNMGSRGNSRPGSRRGSKLNPNGSRPGTSGTDVEAVPDLPSLPSPSLMGETASICEKGDGSTVGLVSGEKEKDEHTIKRKLLRTPGQS